MNTRNKSRAYVVCEGGVEPEPVEKPTVPCGWSAAIPNLSGRIRRSSLRCRKAVDGI